MEKVMASNSNNEQFNLSRGGQLKPDEPNPFTFGAPQVRTKEKRKVHTTLKPHKSNATTSSIVAEVKKDNTAAGQQVDKIRVTGDHADLFTALDDTRLKNLRSNLRHSGASEAGAQRPIPHAIAAVQKSPSQQSFLETIQALQRTKNGAAWKHKQQTGVHPFNLPLADTQRMVAGDQSNLDPAAKKRRKRRRKGGEEWVIAVSG
jgi:hypothetical protein